MKWKDELKRLHLDHIKNTSPGFFAASGGYDMKIKPYTDTNTNGLTRCVIDFLTYKGHYAIRTNRQGQARIERIPIGGTQQNTSGKGVKYHGKVSYTKNPEAKAFTDIQASIGGLYVAIEIKCKATKDRMNDSQEVNKMHVEKSGALWLVVTHFELFRDWYNNVLPDIIKDKLK